MTPARLTRRHVLKAAAGSAAGFALGARVLPVGAAPAQRAAHGPVTRLSDDLFVLTMPGEANVVAHTGPRGVLLVDGASAAASEALLALVAGLPGSGPVHTLVNTHWHPEQTGSNERLGAAGATILAHENTRLWLTTDVTWPWNGRRFTRLPKVAQPNRTFYRAGVLDESSSGTPASDAAGPAAASPSQVRYGYIPDAAHTDGDLYVYFPGPNVMAVGDVLSGDGWPQVDWTTGGWIGGLVGGLQRLHSLVDDDTRLVPGRGPVLSRADLAAQLDMYVTIYNRLTQLLNKGRGPGEAVAAQPAKEYADRMGHPDEFVRLAFESLWAYLSPDA